MAGKILKRTKKETISSDSGNGDNSGHNKAGLIGKGDIGSRDKEAPGLAPLDDCPACQGAIFRYNCKYGGLRSWEEKHLCQCLQCGRIFRKDKEGKHQQWPRRSGAGEGKNIFNDSLYDDWDE